MAFPDLAGAAGAWVLALDDERTFVATGGNRPTRSAWEAVLDDADEESGRPGRKAAPKVRVRATYEPTMLATLARASGDAAQKLVAELCARDERLRAEAATADALVDACAPITAGLAARYLDLGAPAGAAAPRLVAGGASSRLATRDPVWKSTTGLGRPDQTLKSSSSAKSKSIRLASGRIDRSCRVLEARQKSLAQFVQLRAH